ncbi:MAG: LLM class F420-dependent oxidoreductase [Halioglobus sp.]|nr:LLM class F420-dependent oxidoreductase [Halioglobus sp.]MCB1708073.1 LLM class F420-dependent oxidoreductase [Halioglobus sp.]MCP5122185.1 LLM class F420-dependent oxidoreductase [Pseudomonadales bacterium]MCP5192270.1 LLM class F420-dependent oxidoreductase [Pseudomonadales bacterium]
MHLGFSSMNTAEDPAPDLLARTLEEAGFESLWYGEHSHIPVSRLTPYPAGGELPAPYRRMMDPYVSLMAAAAVTSRLKLGTGIALLLERELFSQAKTIATLDRLSNGRLLIGCGVGWNEEEFINATRLPWHRRYLAMRETVLAQRVLFTDAEPEYHGELIDFDPVWLEPKPARPGGPPVIFGAMGPLGVRHAASWADGWMPVDVALPDVARAVADFRQLLRDNDRNPDNVEITLVVMSAVTADLLKSYRDVGIDRCNIGVGMQNWDKPEVVMPMIEQFSKLIPDL